MQVPTMREITDIQVLEHLATAHAQGEPEVSVATINDWFEGDHQAARSWRERHQTLGYVAGDSSLAPHFAITAEGRAYLAVLLGRRTDKGLRRRVCRQRLLHWVDSKVSSTADYANTNEFLLSEHAWFEGDNFTADELADATEYLVSKGLLQGTGKAWGTSYLRLSITHDGQECVTDYESDPAAYLASQRQAGTVVHVQGEGNAVAVAIGANSSASATSIDVDAAVLLAQAFRQAAPVLNLNEDDLQALADIEQRTDPGRVRRGLQRIGRFASDAGTNAIGSVLAAVAMKLLTGS